MTQDVLTDAVSMLDADILEAFEAFRTAEILPRKRQKKLLWGALAACFVLVLSVGVWLFAPLGLANENSLILLLLDPPDGEDYVLKYQRKTDRSYRAEPAVLSLRKGELYTETDTERFYRVKGSNALTSLIGERKDTGDLFLYEFACFSLHMLYEEEIRPMPSLGEVWSMIYGADSAADIRRVTFEPVHVSCAYERALPISTQAVALTTPDELARFYSVLAPLAYAGEMHSVQLVECTSNDYLNGTAPLTVQTARRVTVEFAGGETMHMDFYAADCMLRLWNHADYALSEDDLAWLVDTAAIDLTYRYWGTDKEKPPEAGEGSAVTSPRLTYETEKPIDVGYAD